jgi:hypothetical protein
MNEYVLFYDATICDKKTLGKTIRALDAAGIEFRLAEDAVEFGIGFLAPDMFCHGLNEINWYIERTRAQVVG